MRSLQEAKINLLLGIFLLFGYSSFAQLVADFDYSFGGEGLPCVPLTVNFTNTSTGDINSYSWTIEDTFFSNQPNPLRNLTFGAPYQVCLRITDTNGNLDEICKTIEVFNPPNFTLSTNSDNYCSPSNVTYSIEADVPIDSLIIDYGDGTIEEKKFAATTTYDISYTYEQAGDYSISATIFETHGCSSTQAFANIISVTNSPDASFTASPTASCTIPLNVSFSINNPSINSTTYEWSFGDGTSSSGFNPIHQYIEAGSFDVQLIATDDLSGCSDTVFHENLVNIGENAAAFESEIIYNGNCGNTEVHFTNLTDGEIVSILWDFGDGNTSTEENPIHIYTDEGCYTPTMNINTAGGCEASSTATECIPVNGNVSATYTIGGDASSCTTENGTTINFFGNAPEAISFLWNFGGLGTSTEQNPSFTFTQSGTYPISMTATFADGCSMSVVEETIKLSPLAIQVNASERAGCAPFSVSFENTATFDAPVTAYEWDFGFTTSNLPNPTVVYPDTGDFNVILKITTQDGCSTSILLENYISVGHPPAIDFFADPLLTCAEQEVFFTSISDETADKWYWEFGDGETSEDENPSHKYTSTGVFDISLIIASNGCESSLIKEDYITIIPPLANFEATTFCDQLSVELLDSSLGADSWLWDLGDGTTSDEQHPTHTYTSAGTYTISLTVFNLLTGCDDTLTEEVNITDTKADFTLNSFSACPSDSISIKNISTNAAFYQWIYPAGVSMTPNSFLNDRPTFSFPFPGKYTDFGLIVTDVNDCTDTLMLTDTVTIWDVTAFFDYQINYSCLPVEVEFTDFSSSILSDVVSYYWEFGDGNTSSDPNPIHPYEENGIYTVTLTVKNAQGCVDTYIRQNSIEIDEPVPTFEIQQNNCSTLDLSFVNTTITNAGFAYVWDFGDGTTSNDQSPLHTFASEGTYTVCLSATSGSDCTEQTCRTINVFLPVANFSGDNLTLSCPSTPLITNFTDNSSGAMTWAWDFGDGVSSSLQHPSHLYPEAGNYTVCLTVTNEFGCADTFCQDDYIQVSGPSASFSFTPEEGCSALEVVFSATANNVVQYNWDFGDGDGIVQTTTDNSSEVQHTYTLGGFFAPTLIVEDSTGCAVLIEAEELVEVQTLGADFTSTASEFCEGAVLPINFNAQFDDPSIVNDINWYFPGSNTPVSAQTNPAGVIYTNPGTYNATLEVITDYCTITIVKEDLIQIHPQPSASFIVDSENGCLTQTIEFLDDSSIPVGVINDWHWHMDGEIINTDSSFTYNFPMPDTSYVISLDVMSEEGCTDTFQDTLAVVEGILVDAGDNISICQNESKQLNASTTSDNILNYNWSPSAGLSCTNCPNPMASPSSTTTYYLTILNNDGCYAVDSVEVVVSTLVAPIVELTADTAICVGEIIQIFASGGDSPFNYTWDDSAEGLSCYTNCLNPIASPENTTTYTVYVDNADGCTSSKSVTVEVLDTDFIVLGEDKTICEGASTQLEVLNGTNPSWENDPSLSCLDCFTPTVSPLDTTTYVVSTISPNGCEITDEIQVNILSDEYIDAGDDEAICLGDKVTLFGNFDGEVVWTENGEIVAINEPLLNVEPTETTDYTLSVTVDECTITDQLTITVYDKADVLTEDYEVCEGTSIQVEASGLATQFEWIYSPDLNVIDVPNPIITPSEPSTYTVIGRIGNCEPDTNTVFVDILDNPSISMVENYTFTQGESVTVNPQVQGLGFYDYQWTNSPDLSCWDCPNPVITPDTNSVYQLTVFDENGCADSVMLVFRELFICEETSIVVPTAFTPNEDGHNDEFMVRGSAEFKSMRIYNRWGKLIFESTDPNQGWDGRYKGQLLNRDAYTYHIEAICRLDGSVISKTGDITLIR